MRYLRGKESLAEEIAGLPGLPRKALVERWEKAYGRPPKGISTRLLRLACGYNMQVRKHGGLKKAKLRELLSYAVPPKETKRSVNRSPQSAKPVAGTRLVREWQGKTHVVDVQDGHVLYRKKAYGSLSQVARAITGARWSGPRFFGLSSS